jgi:spermidine synthase
MVASGFAGLGYQIVWTQQFALWLGHEAAAVLAVVTAFFAGLGVGALVLGRRIEASARPERWYAGCELLIALWSLALALLMAPISSWMLALTGTQPGALWQWSVAFFGSFLLLLPATAAMGATLPAMERVTARLGQAGRSIAPLYACNTLGAVIGVLATAFWLIPEWGLLRTAAVCAALNVLCAAAALKLASGEAVAAPAIRTAQPSDGLATLALTGLLGIGYEVLVVRVISQVAEDTVYTFAMLLAVYLVGTALGAAAWQRWLARQPDCAAMRDRLLCALAAACLLGTISLWGAEQIKAWALDTLPAGMSAAIAAEGLLALTAFGLPTLVMGALFSQLSTQARGAGIGFGRSLGANTLGAAAAPLLFGVVLVPQLGPKLSLLLVAAGYLALAWRGWKRPGFWAPCAAALALAALASPLAFIDLPEGARVVSYREGAMAAVSVVEDAEGVSRLRINNRQQEGSSSSLLFDARQGLLPVLLHPAPHQALFLGLGTGLTSYSAAEDPALEVDAVELLPEVIDASAHFTRVFQGGQPNARLHLIAADARRFVRTADRQYDVIVADNFHPARSGSGSLYTVEHFRAVQARLADGGVFCQWLPLHQLDLETLRSIVRAFIAVYPDGMAMLATNSLQTPTLGLVARAGQGRFDVDQVRARLAVNTLPQRLADYGITDEWSVLGGFVAGPSALTRFAGDAPVNTDDHPVVAYRAPRITYASDSLPGDRLLALLAQLQVSPAEVIGPRADAATANRLAAYTAARDRFIVAGQHIRHSPDLRQMLSQVREPLLSALRISPDFRPAYDPLLRMAAALAPSDPAAALALLSELQQLQPARPEAGDLAARINATTP